MTLHEAAKRGDVTAVKTFLDKKKPLDSQDFSAKTDETMFKLNVICPLLNTWWLNLCFGYSWILTRSQVFETVWALEDIKGITALGYAIGANRIAVVKLLLDSRANPYAVDSSGNSGLHYAAGYGRKELLEYLLKVGANVNQPNAEGLTPLAAATQNRQEATMQVLKAHGAQ